ncbi:MAG: hypothetical protein QNJ55_04340 [Xenococcus sp. MO_188.B8]|nr:hypothetical protein [Xenococcus sp. MO_188.B8]
MSIYQNSIQAFIQVIESESNLISHQDWVDLNQLVSDLSEDAEEISKIIEDWLELNSRNQILQAYERQPEVIISSSSIDSDKNLGPGNTKSPTKPNQPSQSDKELLDNAIKKNSPLFNSPPPKQQP